MHVVTLFTPDIASRDGASAAAHLPEGGGATHRSERPFEEPLRM